MTEKKNSCPLKFTAVRRCKIHKMNWTLSPVNWLKYVNRIYDVSPLPASITAYSRFAYTRVAALAWHVRQTWARKRRYHKGIYGDRKNLSETCTSSRVKHVGKRSSFIPRCRQTNTIIFTWEQTWYTPLSSINEREHHLILLEGRPTWHRVKYCSAQIFASRGVFV